MDDNNDKQMMRNQMIAIILMSVLVVVWFKFFMPPPTAKKPQPPAQQTATQTTPQSAQDKPTPEAPMPSSDAWTELPPIPQDGDPEADEVALADEDLEIVLTRIGARLKKATVLLGKEGKQSVQLVPDSTGPDIETTYPLGLTFTEKGLAEELNQRRFDVEKDPSGRAATFSLTIPGKAVIRKQFTLSEKKHVLDVQVDYQSLESANRVLGQDQTPAYYLNWAPNLAGSDVTEAKYKRQSIVWYKGKGIEEMPTNKLKGEPGAVDSTIIPSPEWVAIKNEYFLAAINCANPIPQAVVSGNASRFSVGIAVPRFEAVPQALNSASFQIYMGPSEQRALAQGWDTLPAVLRFFSQTWNWMDWFAKLLLGILNWFYLHVIANYGLAIIFLTAIVRIAMYPLTLKSMRSMKKMQLLAPEIEELKKKHGEDPQEMNRKMMELYRERGVNPLGGCFPMLLQMPVFIALYRMLWYAYELRGAHFVGWINDLSQADKLFHMPWMLHVPLVGATLEYFNLLPILMGAAMVLNQKMMPTTAPAQNQQQKVMMTIMPIFFTFICYTMPAGLNLYILTSTVLGMVQQYFTSVNNKEMEPKKKTVGKRQHFYTAAKARQRAILRETKKEKKNKP